MKLSSRDLAAIDHSIFFLKVGELRKLCERFGLPFNATKKILIDRILTFLKTGGSVQECKIPERVKGKERVLPLQSSMKMMFGSYKNDLVTRIFMKKLVGDHFHFTAFGIDWLKEQWLDGKTPTYAEFAKFWDKEYEHRKTTKAEPKKEWALMCFALDFRQKNPKATRRQVIFAWATERAKQVAVVMNIIKKID